MVTARYLRLIVNFVELHAGMRQRDASWFAAMGTTVGGSEMAAIMGRSPYADIYSVIANKVAILGGTDNFNGGVACWWGTLFEDVLCAYVAADLGAPVHGDDICVRAVPGHRNSPDGYIVAQFHRGADGGPHLWTTDRRADVPRRPQIALLEFKCPLSRKPTGRVPGHYLPQLWSGLAVSPMAHLGLFVDAVFRKCAGADLGDSPDYDTAFHTFDRGTWEQPVAWGLIGVYAPRLDAPRGVRLGWRGAEWAEGDPTGEGDPDADAAQAAWQIHAAYFGTAPSAAALAGGDPADLGDMEARLFGRALGLVDRKRFRLCRRPACFADGRGDPTPPAAAAAAMRAEAPPGFWLFGLLPWKLFSVDYVPVARRPYFLDEVRPLIDGVHAAVAEARATADPAAHVAAARAAARAAYRASSDACGRADADAHADAMAQDLFDHIAPA